MQTSAIFAETVQVEPPPQCQHSWHGEHKNQHDEGPATHIIQLLHVCVGGGPDTRYYYFGCARWVEFLSTPGRRVRCVDCGRHMPVTEFAVPAMEL